MRLKRGDSFLSTTLISEEDMKTLENIFKDRLKGTVILMVFVRDRECEYCGEEAELAKELTGASTYIKAEVVNVENDEKTAAKFGIDVSNGRSRLTPAGKARVKAISKPVHIQVYVTPTCPYCPRAVRIAHQMAIENPLITSDMVEAMEFPDLADKYSVMSVPKMIVNETYHFVGALPEPQFIEQIELALKGAPPPEDE